VSEILPPYSPHVPALPGLAPKGPRDLFDEFLSLRRSPNTQEAYRRDILDFFRENIPADVESFRLRVSFSAVQEWVDHMNKSTGDGGFGLEATTIFRKVAALRGYLDLCVEDAILLINPCRSRRLVLPLPEEWEPSLGLTTLQLRAMGDVCRNDPRELIGLRDSAILSLGFSGCLRVSEIAQASYHDFVREGDQTIYKIPETKGGRNQKVPIGQEAKLRIEEWMTALGGVSRVIPDAGRTNSLRYPLFVSLSKRSMYQRISISAIAKMIKKRGADAGISNIAVHSHLLRHSGITHLIETGWSLTKVQRHARHKDPKTTQKYIDLWELNGRSPADDLGDIFGGKKVSRPRNEVG